MDDAARGRQLITALSDPVKLPMIEIALSSPTCEPMLRDLGEKAVAVAEALAAFDGAPLSALLAARALSEYAGAMQQALIAVASAMASAASGPAN